jgi:hypothetical protein
VPFALTSASQFRPTPPPALRSVRYARDLNETKDFGGSFSLLRTRQQSETANWMTEQAPFADDNPRTTPDVTWSAFLAIPPHPEYPTAHLSVTTAGTRVLTRYFGPHHELMRPHRLFPASSGAMRASTRSR